jgi:hypothetical protein
MSSCQLCRYAKEGDVTPDLKRPLFCKRNPPLVLPVPTPHGVQVLTLDPQVDPGNWCGEYKGRDQVSETKIVTGR